MVPSLGATLLDKLPNWEMESLGLPPVTLLLDSSGVVSDGGSVTAQQPLINPGEIPGLGGYSEYSIADQRISFRVPANVSRAEASSVPLAATTAWLALFSKGCLNFDRSKAGSVLIWGGSSSVGLYAIQLASIFGLTVITTCSPRNAGLVRSYGAQHVFDYNDPDVVGNITNAAPNLQHVFDTIGDKTSSTISSGVFGDRQGHLCTVRPGKANTDQVTANTHVTDVLVWAAFLKDHGYGEFHWPASQEDHELASELFERLPAWLAWGQIKPNKVKIFHGLESVAKGFQEYRDGGVSAYKIVYEI
ncbi:unnamed protein product [Penicillium olsonii]|uniref:Enoyl reductase (ER) domain-containing protein n=1 Tax=Penicillium olsonii TaxID=99116 RepID=A0A9W4MN77_PENOL|nr:unnamed protein product [Penicillium olsonii]CAG8060937.1 unnamed protein product [Penicillium olsonii]